jgi:hypothetical protein
VVKAQRIKWILIAALVVVVGAAVAIALRPRDRSVAFAADDRLDAFIGTWVDGKGRPCFVISRLPDGRGKMTTWSNEDWDTDARNVRFDGPRLLFESRMYFKHGHQLGMDGLNGKPMDTCLEPTDVPTKINGSMHTLDLGGVDDKFVLTRRD